MIDAINNNGRTIRLPVHLCQLMQKSKAVVRKLERELGRHPTDAEIAGRLGVTRSRVRELRLWSRSTTSLDFAAADKDGGGDGDVSASFSDAVMYAAADRGGISAPASGAAEADVEAGDTSIYNPTAQSAQSKAAASPRARLSSLSTPPIDLTV